MPIINKERFLSAEQPPNILVQAILALTFRFVSQHEPAEQYPNASDYAAMYSAKVMKRLRDPVRSRLCHVQSAVLMTLYLDMDDGDDSMQWYMLGTAIRMAQDLGLHRSCSHWRILPQAEIETRHRLFYACYVLDRWLSARAGKPLTILDRDFDTPMPSNNEYQAFAIMIKLSEILGRVLKALYAPKAKHANANAGLDDPTVIDAFDRRLKSCKTAMETEIPLTQKGNLDMMYRVGRILTVWRKKLSRKINLCVLLLLLFSILGYLLSYHFIIITSSIHGTTTIITSNMYTCSNDHHGFNATYTTAT